jgi:hypothetical protein
MANPKSEKPPPACKAILICEKTLRESRTGRITLIGIIREIPRRVIPGWTDPMVVFLQLVNGKGHLDLTIEVQHLQTDNTIVKTKGIGVDFPDPLTVRNLTLRLSSLPIAVFGTYDLIVFGNGQEIDRQQFKIVPSTSHGSSET